MASAAMATTSKPAVGTINFLSIPRFYHGRD
jgi:hypothetical protein